MSDTLTPTSPTTTLSDPGAPVFMSEPVAPVPTPETHLYMPHPKKIYLVDGTDTIMALALVVFGYLAWSWICPAQTSVTSVSYPGIAFTLYICAALAASMVYFRVRRVALNKPAIIGAAILVFSALPFALYDTTPVHFFAWAFVTVGYVVWHAYAAGTAISPIPGALTAADVLNQAVVVPASNAGSWAAALKGLLRGKKSMTQFIVAVVGVAVALPVIVLVVSLLTDADDNFNSWVDQVGHSIADFDVWGFLWKFCLAIPVAIYLFSLMYGNAHRMGTESITHERAARWSGAARKIAVAAVATPTAILCMIYIMFFSAMGSSLFGAFTGTLPAEKTYADFARQGFFQLAIVAGINLAVLGFAYLFAKREETYPRSLRVIGTILSALTILLVVTAMSKMILYIDQYGLTRLRVYTLWFMGVLFIVFLLVGAWHVRRFRVDIPLLLVVLVSFIGLTWANTDGLIADYNVHQYLNGNMDFVDIWYLQNNLSDAAVPALIDLKENTSDVSVYNQAEIALQARLTSGDVATWTSWNWQTSHMGHLLR